MEKITVQASELTQTEMFNAMVNLFELNTTFKQSLVTNRVCGITLNANIKDGFSDTSIECYFCTDKKGKLLATVRISRAWINTFIETLFLAK